jgi:ABC-type proline/glycine betaine transport system ATPase subunit
MTSEHQAGFKDRSLLEVWITFWRYDRAGLLVVLALLLSLSHLRGGEPAEVKDEVRANIADFIQKQLDPKREVHTEVKSLQLQVTHDHEEWLYVVFKIVVAPASELVQNDFSAAPTRRFPDALFGDRSDSMKARRMQLYEETERLRDGLASQLVKKVASADDNFTIYGTLLVEPIIDMCRYAHFHIVDSNFPLGAHPFYAGNIYVGSSEQTQGVARFNAVMDELLVVHAEIKAKTQSAVQAQERKMVTDLEKQFEEAEQKTRADIQEAKRTGWSDSLTVF